MVRDLGNPLWIRMKKWTSSKLEFESSQMQSPKYHKSIRPVSGAYLFFNILKRAWTNNGKTNKKHVCLWIWEWTKTIVIFLTWKTTEQTIAQTANCHRLIDVQLHNNGACALTSSIEKAECVRLAANHNCDSIVIEDSWNVFGWKFVGGVRDEQASLTDCTVADNNALYSLHIVVFHNCLLPSLDAVLIDFL